MTTVYIHIGHGKTGSTSIQNFFYKYREILAHNNITYIQKNYSGEIRSGDAKSCIDFFNADRDVVETENFFFSSELLVYRIANEAIKNKIISRLKSGQVSRVKIIAFTRDPEGMLKSSYLQHIKARYCHQSAQDYCLNSSSLNVYEFLSKVIELYHSVEGVTLDVLNFDERKRDLNRVVIDFLGLDYRDFPDRDSEDIKNRTINNIEAQTMLGVNSYINDGVAENKINFDLVPRWGEPYRFPEFEQSVYEFTRVKTEKYIKIINEVIADREFINVWCQEVAVNKLSPIQTDHHIEFSKLIGMYCTVEKVNLLNLHGEKTDEASRYVRQLVDLIKPNYKNLSTGQCFLIGRCLLKFDYWNEALFFLNRGIELNPKFCNNIYQRSKAHFYLENLDEALADIKRAIELAPENVGYKKWQDMLN